MNKDWGNTLLVIIMSVVISVACTLFIVDQYDKRYASKMIVMDIAGSIKYLQDNNKIPEGGGNQIIKEMLEMAKLYSDSGYIVLDKSAVITTHEDYIYEYHGK